MNDEEKDWQMKIQINGVQISTYLSKYQCQIEEVYDEDNSFKSLAGTENKIYLGDRRILNVDFEPMNNAQIKQLFNAIKSNRNIEIKYLDPQYGLTLKIFSCTRLPSATYFESDYPKKVLFWTIPTVTFTEIGIDSEGGLEGIYDYRMFIDSVLYPSERIADNITINNNISTNGFGVGQIATKSMTAKVILAQQSDAPTRNNAEIIFQRCLKENQEWKTIGIFFMKDFTITDKIMSFNAMDSAAFLDNNYFIDYERDEDGEIIPQHVSGHLNAITEMVKELTNHTEYNIPYSCDDVIIQSQDSQTARTIVQKAAESGGINYREKLVSALNDNSGQISLEMFTIGGDSKTFLNSQVSDLDYGKTSNNLETIILYCGSTTKLPTHLYVGIEKDYNIYVVGNTPTGGYPIVSKTLEVKAPYYPFSAEEGGNFNQLLNTNFGSEFSAMVYIENGDFIPLGSKIIFSEQNLNNYYFYATSISYKFSINGLYANISGSAKNDSDYIYIGGMQREMENKLTLNSTYGNIYIGTDGLQFTAPKE